jgi:hypothetical protein
VLDGQDPVAYVLSSNVNRRHMTKGQRPWRWLWSVKKHYSQRVKSLVRLDCLTNEYITPVPSCAIPPTPPPSCGAMKPSRLLKNSIYDAR